MTRDIQRTADDASTPQPVTRRTVLQSTAAGIAAAGGATATVAGQSGEETSGSDDEGGDELNGVSFDLANLPELDGGSAYEAWATFGDETISLGVFQRGDEYAFGADRDLATADEIAITVESSSYSSGRPSGAPFLRGEPADGEVDLSFPVDLGEPAGSFLLNTPTAPDAPATSGVWFLEPDGDGGHEASLDLPDLSDVTGWTYEGWLVLDGEPLSMGRFADPAAADGAAPYSGDADAPPFPGEDFVENEPPGFAFPTDLTDADATVAVTLETDVDGDSVPGTSPFQIKPLAGDVPADAEGGASQAFPRNDGTLPSGTATLHRNVDAAAGRTDQQNAVAFDLPNLPRLGPGAYYECWARFGEDEVRSMGRIAKGQTYVLGVDRDLAAAEELLITIEREDEDYDGPSQAIYLSGEVEDGEADLSFPMDLSDARGTYTLATRETEDAPDTAGLWFADVEADGEAEASLSLPDPHDGWAYEGWVRHEGELLSMGRFPVLVGHYQPARGTPGYTVDTSAEYYESSTTGSDGFPGEEFVQNAPEGLEFPADLTDGDTEVFVTVEPLDLHGDPDGPTIFDAPVLHDTVPADAEPRTNVELHRDESAVPTGTATLYDDLAAAPVGPDDDTAVGFTLPDLPQLPDGAVYEGWAVFEDEKVSTGTFAAGQEYVFGVDRDLATADSIAITIEPANDDDPGPSGVVVLAGAVEDGEADLSFPVGFDQAASSYLLNTPTAPEAAGESGLWFLEPDPEGDGHVASLDLPDLTNVRGWTYEGWAVIDGQPVTTGRFDDPAMADDAAPYSGDADAPPFPGEDFVANAPEGLEFPANLADGESKAVITVEPDLDGTDPTGDGPFPIKPLVADVPADAEPGTSYDLEADEDAPPAGSATVYDDLEAARSRHGRNALVLDVPELAQSDRNEVYEVWAVYGDVAVPLERIDGAGEFVVGADRDLSKADELLVTVEYRSGNDFHPSEAVLLRGEVRGDEVGLSFPLDFSDASGSYLLNTPTAPDVAGESGVWFLRPDGDGGHEASLDLPDLTDGPWTYEASVRHDGEELRIGRFDDPTAPDDSASFSGEADAPPFPGEDFVANAPEGLEFPADLADGESTVAIAVQPNTGPLSSTLRAQTIRPLTGEIPADAEPGTSYELDREAQAGPTGAATLYDDVERAREATDDGDPELTLELANLPELEQGAYEAWAIFGGEDVLSLGQLDGRDRHTASLERDLENLGAVAVTIEPEDGDDEMSHATILRGEVEDGVATLSWPTALDGPSGSFLLNTPTAPDAPATSGVWFLQPDGDGGHEASLDLPDLSGVGWTYEGWIVHEGVRISTGTFDAPTFSDYTAPYAGEEEPPELPGGDLVQNAPAGLEFPTDLTDGETTVAVTVEPEHYAVDPSGPGPFAFEILSREIPADAEAGVSYELDRNDLALPSGTAVVEDATVAIGDAVVQDVNGDGHYRDVDGDDEVGQGDVAAFFQRQHRDAWKRPELFDYSGNGAVTHGDVVELFDYVALN